MAQTHKILSHTSCSFFLNKKKNKRFLQLQLPKNSNKTPCIRDKGPTSVVGRDL